jgi:hypothetical protein
MDFVVASELESGLDGVSVIEEIIIVSTLSRTKRDAPVPSSGVNFFVSLPFPLVALPPLFLPGYGGESAIECKIVLQADQTESARKVQSDELGG